MALVSSYAFLLKRRGRQPAEDNLAGSSLKCWRALHQAWGLGGKESPGLFFNMGFWLHDCRRLAEELHRAVTTGAPLPELWHESHLASQCICLHEPTQRERMTSFLSSLPIPSRLQEVTTMRRTSKTPVQLVNSLDEAICRRKMLAEEAVAREKAKAKAAKKAKAKAKDDDEEGDNTKKKGEEEDEEAPESTEALENEISDYLADLKVLLWGDITSKAELDEQLDEVIVKDICLILLRDDLIAKLLSDIKVRCDV